MFREMRRKKQALTREDCETLLREVKRGHLSVVGDGGYPYIIPINFVYYDGSIYFHSAKEGHKIDALNNNSKACFNIIDNGYQEEGDWAYFVRSVVVFGHLHIVEDENLKDTTLRHLGMKYFPEEVDLEKEMYGAPRVSMLCLDIEHMSGKLVHEK